MENIISIIDIRKVSMNYFCFEPELLIEKGYVSANFEIEEKEHEDDEETQITDIKFVMLVSSEPIQDIDVNEIEAKFEVTYRVVYNVEENNEKVKRQNLVKDLEPYIRKDIMDFYINVDLPKIAIPYGFWKYAEEN